MSGGASWRVWKRLYEIDGFVLAGFRHQCGRSGLLEGSDWGDTMCPGCRYDIERPITECEPLYARKPGEIGFGAGRG